MSTASPAHFSARLPFAAIEAAGIALFMVSAIGFTIVLEHPGSPVRMALPDPLLRRFVMGCAMGATLVALVYNRFGQRSGAHYNPVFTFTFWRLGKLDGALAALYAAAQFGGAIGGVVLLSALLPELAGDQSVRHAATRPGPAGVGVAFLAESAIAFLQMSIVLFASSSKRLHRATGLFAALGVALYITFEAPLSGMSMNPARTLGSAVGEGSYADLWLYFAAPLLGMLLAAETHVRLRGLARVYCAKLDHGGDAPCPFFCRHGELVGEASATGR